MCMFNKKPKKEKKEKIIYIDDGSTIADMSIVVNGKAWKKRGTASSARDIWRTYWSAVRMMVKPTLIAVGFLLVAYGIVALIFLAMR